MARAKGRKKARAARPRSSVQQVKVRLRAEGVADVVASLKRVRAEAERTSEALREVATMAGRFVSAWKGLGRWVKGARRG